jgi:molybdopterin/thiamine biosynthesis adenylyltransferase/rhodanese-related sulfurtransferase
MRALVEPGPPLSPGDVLRFSRHALLPQVGDLGQRRLRRASVCVVGAGGLGSPALLYLAAAGVGRLGVVDRDEVDMSNLQRQVLHGTADVGRRKVHSACDALLAIDPGVDVVPHDVDLTSTNVRDVLSGYDVVLDGSDNFPTRYVVNDGCADLGVPLVWGSVLGFDAQVSVFWSRPPGGDGIDLRDLFPEPPAPGEVLSCAQAGVLGALCGQVGALMATEAVKLIVGTGEPLLGRVLVLDALATRWREIPLRRAPDRVVGFVRDGRGEEPVAAGEVSATGAPGVAGGCVPVRSGVDDVATVEPADLALLLRTEPPPALVDVREPAEHEAGSIPGSRTVPLSLLRSGGGLADLPEGVPLVLYCSVGVRSAEAASILRAAGRRDVRHLEGGYVAWRLHVAQGRPGALDAPRAVVGVASRGEEPHGRERVLP